MQSMYSSLVRSLCTVTLAPVALILSITSCGMGLTLVPTYTSSAPIVARPRAKECPLRARERSEEAIMTLTPSKRPSAR